MQYLRLIQPGLVAAILAIAALAAMVGAGIAKARGAQPRVALSKAAAAALFGAGCVITLLVTLPTAGAPAPSRYFSFNAVSDIGEQVSDATISSTAAIQLIMNLLLLSWIGVLLPLLSSRVTLLAATTLAALSSILIESLQYALNNGRVAALSDLLLNTVGGLTGAAIGILLLRPRLEKWLQESGAQE